MILDFSKCKTVADVEKIWKSQKVVKELKAIKKVYKKTKSSKDGGGDAMQCICTCYTIGGNTITNGCPIHGGQ